MSDDIRELQHQSHFYVETVSLSGRRGEDTETDEVDHATRLPMSRASRVFGVAQLSGDEAAFVLPAAEVINLVSPRKGDVITDADDVEYQVTDIREVNARSQWICMTVERPAVEE